MSYSNIPAQVVHTPITPDKYQFRAGTASAGKLNMFSSTSTNETGEQYAAKA
jgi:hypothetical protein